MCKDVEVQNQSQAPADLHNDVSAQAAPGRALLMPTLHIVKAMLLS